MMPTIWAHLPVGDFRWSTVAMALLVLAAVTFRRGLPLAAVTVLAWVSAFETIDNLVGGLGFHWPLTSVVWVSGALLGWVVLAHVVGVRPNPAALVLFALVMVAWIATGFHYNVAHGATFDYAGEAFNELAKTLLGVAYLLGALRLRVALPGGRTAAAAPSARYPSRPGA
jgi:hypothetical protein